MPILTVGPNSTFPTIAAAMAAAADNDEIQLETGYSNETATVTHQGMTVTGGATSTGIVLNLATGVPIATFTLAGTAPINVFDNTDGGTITGNDGTNVITVTDGVDAVNGGAGTDRLVVDYHLTTTAVTGDSTSNFADASGRLVTITGGFENFTILTGSGVDTITTGAGDDIINTGEGTSTVTAGQGANIITGGSGTDTITALDGGNIIDGGDGANTITSGGGADTVSGGTGTDTIVAGGGNDLITMVGGADTVQGDAGFDRLVVNYSTFNTAVTGGVTSGTLLAGYTGSLADLSGNTVSFETTENFTVTTGSGNDTITTGDGIDVLNTGAGVDVLHTAGGNDTLTGGLGADLLDGGADNDTFVIAGTQGFGDTFMGGSGIDTLQVTGAGAVWLTGFNTVDSSIQQWDGNNQAVRGTAANNNFNFSALTSKTGLPFVDSGGGNDTLTGSNFADSFRGGAGLDTLKGGVGRDTLAGGLGHDTLIGGLGRDLFDFNSIKESKKGAQRDSIIDFQRGQDDIDLRTIDAKTGGGNQAFKWIGKQGFHDEKGELRYKDLGSKVIVQGDVNGDGKADFEIFVKVGALASGDFLL